MRPSSTARRRKSWKRRSAQAPACPARSPFPLTKRSSRSCAQYKDSREQFENRTHKRLIDILKPSNKTVEALTSLQLPAGVDIEIKL